MARNPSAGRGGPWLWLLLIGGGSLVMLLGSAARFQRAERIPLTNRSDVTAAEFRVAQSAWKQQGLHDARFAGGVIQVPQDQIERYRQTWQSETDTTSRSRWADMWQQANDRLGHFSGARERDAARDISRAQVVARLLEELPDVETADIVWDEAESQGWRTPEQARATVYLKAAAGCSIGPDVVDAVRKAVAGGKAHLTPENVIVMDQSRMVAWGGDDASAADVRTAQLVAVYRSRLQSALQHIPAVKIEIHANSRASSANDAVPVAVGVGIPDGSIRQLARLSEAHATGNGSDPFQERRREVFRTVEQHLHQLIVAKARQLIPAGLVLENDSHLLVETLPATMSATPLDAQPRQSSLAIWLQQNAWGVLAVFCGVSALSMFRPRPQTVMADSAADRNAITVQTEARSLSASGEESAAFKPIATAHRTPAASAVAEPAAKPTERATPSDRATARSESITASPENRADLLREVLLRLEQPSSISPSVTARDKSPVAGSPAPVDRLRVVSGRTATGSLEQVAVEDFDLEQLRHLSDSELRTLVAGIDCNVWSRALFTASPQLRDRILPCLPGQEGDRILRELQVSRPIRLREIDAAQAEIRQAWDARRQESPMPALTAARPAPLLVASDSPS